MKLAELKAIRAELPDDSDEAREIDSILASEVGVPPPIFQPLVAPNPEADPIPAEEKAPPPPRKNPKLASASKNEDSYRDPEFIPGNAGVGAALPKEVGGNLEAWDEPSIEQFRQETAPFFADNGLDVNQVDEGSDEFREYADSKWQEVYDQAKSKGIPVARLSYMNSPEWRKANNKGPVESVVGKGLQLAAQAPRALLSGAYGYLDGRTAPGAAELASKGLEYLPGSSGNEREVQQYLAQKYPVSRAIGEVGGALDPRSFGSYIGTKGMKALGGGAPGLVRRTAVRGASGATQSAVGGALGEGVSQAIDIAEDKRSGFDAQRMEDKAKINALLGGGLGVGGEILGSGARAAADKILPPADKALSQFAGFKFGFGGIEPPKDVKGAISKAEEAGVAPESVLADEFAPRYQQAGSSFFESGQPKTETVTKDVYEPFSVDLTKLSPEESLSHAQALHFRVNQTRAARTAEELDNFLTHAAPEGDNSYFEGRLIDDTLSSARELAVGRPTVAANGANAATSDAAPATHFAKVRKLGLWREQWVPEHEARALAEREGGQVLGDDELQSLGVKAPFGRTGVKLVMLPKKLTPQEVASAYRASKLDPTTPTEVAETLETLARSIKGTRPADPSGNSGPGDKAATLKDMVNSDIFASSQPKKQTTMGGKRVQAGKLPQGAETDQGFLTWEDMSKRSQPRQVEMENIIDPGMDPVELARQMDLAGIPNKGGQPIPWEQMDANERLALSRFLEKLGGGKAKYQQSQAADAIADVGGIADPLKQFRGKNAGLKLMGKTGADSELPVEIGPRGPWLRGIPKSAFVRLDPILNAMSGARPGMTAVGAQYDDEQRRKVYDTKGSK